MTSTRACLPLEVNYLWGTKPPIPVQRIFSALFTGTLLSSFDLKLEQTYSCSFALGLSLNKHLLDSCSMLGRSPHSLAWWKMKIRIFSQPLFFFISVSADLLDATFPLSGHPPLLFCVHSFFFWLILTENSNPGSTVSERQIVKTQSEMLIPKCTWS